jgi:CheB methylesterase
MTHLKNRDIIVIGGSSGATAPLKTILGAFPTDLPAAVFVVLHIPARSIGVLATVAGAAGRLPVHQATDGMPIVPGNVYLAVADHHLILTNGRMKLGRGPRENMARPAVDALFRSAAVAYAGPGSLALSCQACSTMGRRGLKRSSAAAVSPWCRIRWKPSPTRCRGARCRRLRSICPSRARASATSSPSRPASPRVRACRSRPRSGSRWTSPRASALTAK